MFNYEKIDLTFSFPSVFFLIALILLGGYAYYVYRYTVPAVSAPKKIFLTSLRTLALILLLFIFFEPILTLAQKNILKPINLIFVDNSRSILIDDGTNRKQNIENFLNKISNKNLPKNSEVLAFGSSIKKINEDSLSQINFSEGSTNFEKIFSNLEKANENISSIVVISDGAITEGENPLLAAEKLNIPVFTIGVGDTTKHNDVEIKNVLFNEFFYAETPTTILAAVSNIGFEGKQNNISLFENDNLIEQKNIILNKDGIQNISFEYKPKTSGEKKLTIKVDNLNGEFTFANNKKVFYINVLSNKIKVLLLAGAPSPDLSFIKNTLKEDKNLSVNSITQINENKFLENNNRENIIDSADIFFLIGFPSRQTNNEILRKVQQSIMQKNVPYFFLFSEGIDYNKLNTIQNSLAFTISKASQNFNEVQPNISTDQIKNPILQNNSQNILSAWNNLPPVFQPNAEIKAKPESEVISKIKVNNVPLNTPLILTRKIGRQRSISVTAKDIWKWKLQTSQKDFNLFDSFIINSIKWLNTSEDKKNVNIKTSKKKYSLGEQIEFSAQVYDESLNPVSDAEVKIKIKNGDKNFEINLNSLGSGLYEGAFQTSAAGDYSFNGEAIQNEKKLGNDNGKFNIGDVDIEMMSPRMNYEFLNQLANLTNGEYFNSNNYQQLFEILNKRNKNISKEKLSTNEFRLWSNEWLMAVVIFLFALEWFFRKRSGML
ncbi:MAG: hypothetical protein ABI550_02955 [Ignavibacteriaceae bacterium]